MGNCLLCKMKPIMMTIVPRKWTRALPVPIEMRAMTEASTEALLMAMVAAEVPV
ncbi:hypothetical protein J1N35_006472 [Gossypium stocksii]|uniref:Uncharacterized protein n=1 Tax=Gossypium stocksii TaxID=47602 RepID=A0A9D3WG29_9ROSI|nr:hypothetical protein J1N35_006472 [Gossypium stocksii]